MSITDDLKGYADAAVETGRSAVNDGISQGRAAVNERLTALRTGLDGGIDAAGERAGQAAESATGLGTHALNRARYNAYAVVGAGDAAVTGVLTRLQELPTDVVTAVTRVGDRVAGVASGSYVAQAKDSVREGVDAYGKQLTVFRAQMYQRGEHVVATVRKDPRVQKVAGLVGAAVVEVEDAAATPARRRSAEKGAETRARNERSARATKAATTRARKTAATPRKRAAKKTTTGTTAKTTG